MKYAVLDTSFILSCIRKKIDFFEAFNLFIKGQVVADYFSVFPYGDKSIPPEERYYGEGIIMENGYKFIQYGGGCSGEDCNTSFIIDNEDKLVASNGW